MLFILMLLMFFLLLLKFYVLFCRWTSLLVVQGSPKGGVVRDHAFHKNMSSSNSNLLKVCNLSLPCPPEKSGGVGVDKGVDEGAGEEAVAIVAL